MLPQAVCVLEYFAARSAEPMLCVVMLIEIFIVPEMHTATLTIRMVGALDPVLLESSPSGEVSVAFDTKVVE